VFSVFQKIKKFKILKNRKYAPKIKNYFLNSKLKILKNRKHARKIKNYF